MSTACFAMCGVYLVLDAGPYRVIECRSYWRGYTTHYATTLHRLFCIVTRCGVALNRSNRNKQYLHELNFGLDMDRCMHCPRLHYQAVCRSRNGNLQPKRYDTNWNRTKPCVDIGNKSWSWQTNRRRLDSWMSVVREWESSSNLANGQMMVLFGWCFYCVDCRSESYTNMRQLWNSWSIC